MNILAQLEPSVDAGCAEEVDGGGVTSVWR